MIKCEEKMAELQAELQAFRSQVQTPYSVLFLFPILQNLEKRGLDGVKGFFFCFFFNPLEFWFDMEAAPLAG